MISSSLARFPERLCSFSSDGSLPRFMGVSTTKGGRCGLGFQEIGGGSLSPSKSTSSEKSRSVSSDELHSIVGCINCIGIRSVPVDIVQVSPILDNGDLKSTAVMPLLMSSSVRATWREDE